MATPCIITVGGKDYTPAEFMDMLVRDSKMDEVIGYKAEGVKKADIFDVNNQATKEKPFISKNGKYKVYIENGDAVVEHIDGVKVSRETKKKYIEEYKENFKYDTGNDFQGQANSVEQLIEQSSNPAEIADIVLAEPKHIPEDMLDYNQRAIANSIGRVSTEDFTRITGLSGKDIPDQVRRAYLSKDGQPLDMVAMEAEADAYGDYNANYPRIEPQDVVDFIMEHPSVEAFWKQKNPIYDLASNRFKELTGLPLDKKTLKLASDEIAKRQGTKGLPEDKGGVDESAFTGKAKDAQKATELVSEKKSGKSEAKQRLAEAKKKLENYNKSNKIAEDPEEKARLLFEYHKALVDVAKEYIRETADKALHTAEEFAKYVGEKVEDVRAAWSEASGGVKKTFVTKRAYEGKFRESVKNELERTGLTREIENQDTALSNAKKFVESVGDEAAIEAVRNGDVRGGEATAVWGTVLENIDKKISSAKSEDEVRRLNELQGALMQELDQMLLEGGRAASMMNKIYNESDLGYNLQKKINEYKEKNNGVIPEDVEKKFREYDAQLKEVKSKLAEAEQRAKEAEEKAVIDNIKQSIQRQKSNKTYAQKAKRAADYVRQFKNKPFELRDENGNIIDVTKLGVTWNDVVESIAVGLEKAGELADVINDALKDAAWYQNLSPKGQEAVRKQLEEKFAVDTETTQGRIKIPHQMIRDFVEGGVENIDQLVYSVKQAIKADYPDATSREIRDAITGYGKTVNSNRDEIEMQIRKLKRVGRVVSALEDVRNKKRPLRSGLQRDKLDAEERALNKELREAMKDLPMDAEAEAEQLKTQTDAAKTRLRNQIEDLEREIATGEQVPRSARTVKEDAELQELRAKRDALKAEHEKIFKDEEFKEKKRLEAAKQRAQKKIEDLQRRIKEGDFSKKEKKATIEDTELVKLNAEKLRIQELYDKEFHKNELRNMSMAEKVKARLWDLWSLPRAVVAGFEFSFMGVQGLKQSVSNPTQAIQAFKNAMKVFGSEAKAEDFIRNIKSQEWYPIAKKAGLAISEPSAKLTAREELYYSGWTNAIWDGLGMAVLSPAKFKSRESFNNAVEAWRKANPFKPFERAAVGYLDTLRVMRFLDGVEMLKLQGKNIQDNPKDYKDVADAINTLTGRASLGKLEGSSEMLTKLFFSPRNWASGIKTATPYALYHFGKMTPTARKMAISDLSKFVGLTTGMVALAAAKLNNDDDENTGVEFDPRSSEFMKIKLEDGKYVDPWGGMQQQVVFSTRIIMDALFRLGLAEGAYKKDGKVTALGEGKTPTLSSVVSRQAFNKLNPTASFLKKYADSKLKKDGTRVNEFGEEYSLGAAAQETFTNIFASTVMELLKEDPKALDGLLTAYAFFGGGVTVYDEKKKKKSGSQRPERPQQSSRPKREQKTKSSERSGESNQFF